MKGSKMASQSDVWRPLGVKVSSPNAHVRRAFLKSLRSVAEALRLTVSTWADGAKMWDADAGRTRYRTVGEFPENNAARLRADAKMLDQCAAVLMRVADQMRDQATALDEAERIVKG